VREAMGLAAWRETEPIGEMRPGRGDGRERDLERERERIKTLP
jgi:hypothetical protein